MVVGVAHAHGAELLGQPCQVLWAFCCANRSAVLSLATAPSWKRVHLLVLSFALGAFYSTTHSWLVDSFRPSPGIRATLPVR